MASIPTSSGLSPTPRRERPRSRTRSTTRRRCLGTTRRGRPCGAWPITGSHFCFAHRHQANPPSGYQESHPSRPTLETSGNAITHLYQELYSLSNQLAQAQDEDRFTQLLSTYSRTVDHLARLLSENRLLPHQPADSLKDLIGLALDQLGEELAIDL
jgi:hypothetical protein